MGTMQFKIKRDDAPTFELTWTVPDADLTRVTNFMEKVHFPTGQAVQTPAVVDPDTGAIITPAVMRPATREDSVDAWAADTFSKLFERIVNKDRKKAAQDASAAVTPIVGTPV